MRYLINQAKRDGLEMAEEMTKKMAEEMAEQIVQEQTEKAEKKGYEQGRSQGYQDAILDLYRRQVFSLEQAAGELGMSTEEFQKLI